MVVHVNFISDFWGFAPFSFLVFCFLFLLVFFCSGRFGSRWDCPKGHLASPNLFFLVSCLFLFVFLKTLEGLGWHAALRATQPFPFWFLGFVFVLEGLGWGGAEGPHLTLLLFVVSCAFVSQHKRCLLQICFILFVFSCCLDFVFCTNPLIFPELHVYILRACSSNSLLFNILWLTWTTQLTLASYHPAIFMQS